MRLSKSEGIFFVVFIFLAITIARYSAEISGPIEGSMYSQAQQELAEALVEIDRQDEKRFCQKIGSDLRFSTRAVIWYDNPDTNQYMCLLKDLDDIDPVVLAELRKYGTVMNSEKAIRRYEQNESN